MFYGTDYKYAQASGLTSRKSGCGLFNGNMLREGRIRGVLVVKASVREQTDVQGVSGDGGIRLTLGVSREPSP